MDNGNGNSKNMDMKEKCNILRTGIDIGSTTAKTVLLDSSDSPIFTDYRRHDAQIRQTIGNVFQDILNKLGDITITLNVTGSAGMGISERLNIPFIQEVVASAEVAQKFHPEVRTLLDIGGEDSKLIFFDGRGRSDIRMNGNCAGGTGAFIDQMAVLLGVHCEDLNAIAEQHESIHPIASRCGVFAKTDIQALMSRGVSSPDIAASVFHAVALQTLNTLARGFDPRPKVLFSGGPLTFLPMLREVLAEKMRLEEDDVVIPMRPELFSAVGAALTANIKSFEISITEFLRLMDSGGSKESLNEDREIALFDDEKEFNEWNQNRFTRVERVDIRELDKKECFVGIDSGSTTTKMAMIDSRGRIALDHYIYNKGDHVAAVQEGFDYFSRSLREHNVDARIMGTAATGYGEDFIKTVFGLDMGIVETLAHYRAARHLMDDVSFILDIGGQDMKALFVHNGVVNKIEINEACSSGCGTFLQTFAEILNCSVADFAEQACSSSSPCDLGSRCTVFMNSKVKQFLREGADIQDMAAGLAYSVVRNCLNKVLKIKDLSKLGEKIVVQGGTFLNPSVQRAFERLTGKEVLCPDIAGLMGAYGCALAVKDNHLENGLPQRSLSDFEEMGKVGDCKKKFVNCNGCSNQCSVTRLKFDNGRVFYSGNRCERVFSNGSQQERDGFNLARFEEDLIFQRDKVPALKPKLTIGIPRALNIYENFPFWCTMFVQLGMEVRISSPSNADIYEKGAGTIMSDSICFPAKLVHGHIIDLIEKGVDRIFYPTVVYEQHEQKGSNSYNCPIVTGYPDVIRSSVNPEGKHGVPFDMPTFSFKDINLLRKSCLKYFRQLGVSRRHFSKAFSMALDAHVTFKQTLREKALDVVKTAAEEGRKVIMLMGRPYHLDRFINHGVPEILSQMGMDVITCDSVPPSHNLDDVQVLTQWEYSNRLYNAGKFAYGQENVEVVQLNSFGCGLDAISTDELSEILKGSGKNLTVLRIDEIASPGSIKLRLRTLVESLKFRKERSGKGMDERPRLPVFMDEDKDRLILLPFFSEFYSPFVNSAFEHMGYNFKVLPPPDRGSLEVGLKYANNEICYPAIIVVGDILRALQSGEYDLSRVAVGITQTGAQCRASNYVTLIKKGLIEAGFDKIPVVTVHFKSETLNEQPGFSFNRMELMKAGFYSLAFADALTLMYHPLLVREKVRGSAWKIAQSCMDLWHEDKERSPEKTLELIGKAVDEFNRLPVNEGNYPKIGIVGEIYAKYNAFCNHNVVEWLSRNGVEVDVPCIMNFFTQGFVNFRVDRQKFLERKNIFSPLTTLFQKRTDRFLGRVDSVLKQYRYYRPFPMINDIAEKASHVMDLANQFGEGWLIPGEIIKMVEHGVENILCLQPFGCIANQVIAKGVEKSLRDLYPNLNILFVDLDANTSEANMFNRLHFLVKSARVSMELNHGKEEKYSTRDI